MWHSKADIMKDLASIDDFCDSEKKGSFKVLYSFGRGTKTQQNQKFSDTFIDYRTGEAINFDNAYYEMNDTCCKSKGRGHALGSFSRSKSQLQKQLRLARPYGSSDEVVESFFNRNMPVKSQKNSISTSDSESDSQKKSEISVGISNSPFGPLKAKQRVKAVRNSKLQHNVLISNLLSKAITTPGLNLTEKQNFENNDDGDDDDDDDDDNTTTITSSSSVDGTSCNNNDTIESDIEKYDSDKRMKIGRLSNRVKNLTHISNNTEVLNEGKLECKIKTNPRIMVNFSNDGKQTNSTNEIYNRPGNRVNKRLLRGKYNGDGIYDFGKFLSHLSSVETDSVNEAENFCEPTSECFITDNREFPLLKRK